MTTPVQLEVPSDEEGQWLAAFESCRWHASRAPLGGWTGGADGVSVADDEPRKGPFGVGAFSRIFDPGDQDLPEPIAAAIALHSKDWLNQEGKLTTLGASALSRWIAARA